MTTQTNTYAQSHQNERGLTFIEIVIVLAVVALLAGVIAPSMMSVTKDAQASNIISLFETMKSATTKHYADTNQLAREFSGTRYKAAQYHELYMSQKTPGWKGPYIGHPLGIGDNPFSKTIHLYDTAGSIKSHAGGGFDLNGDGTDEITGAANILVLWGVPKATAKAVDDSIDRGGMGTWTSAGRVEWKKEKLTIFLIKP